MPRLHHVFACVAGLFQGCVLALVMVPRGWAAGPDPLDWPNWRGPHQNGMSDEKGLPGTWSPEGENLLWRQEALATRSTPIVLAGRLYTICRAFPESTQDGEKVVCVDAATGQVLWESIHNVFLSDAPAERVGWSSVVGDPETGNVYFLGLGCYFQCLNGTTGEPIWTRSLIEELGMLSTYGGRTNFPIIFENLVIISGVTTAWGEQAIPAHRFYAFDKRTGQLVWSASTRPRPEDTTYCTPFVTTINGQAAMVFGAGDGSVYAWQPRTGKLIWQYDASNRGINMMPLVAKGVVYGGHSEQNLSDNNVLGALFAFTADRKGNIEEKDLLWKFPGRTVGRSQPMLIGDRVYAADDGGTLWIVDAKTGRDVAHEKVGRIMFGSMVFGDGKLYVGEATGRWTVLAPSEKGVEVLHQLRLNGEEILGSPIISHGRIYLPTGMAMYCIGNPESIKASAAAAVAPPAAPDAGRAAAATSRPATARPASARPAPARPAPARPATPRPAPAAGAARPSRPAAASATSAPVAQLQIFPAEVLLSTGGTQPFEVRGFDADGNYVKSLTAPLSLDGPGSIDQKGLYTAAGGSSHTATIVTAKAGELTATARIRGVPPLPWKFDFSDKKVPVTWIGAAYRHQPRDVDGEPALVKISTIPKGTRSQSWMGPTGLHDYTVQADFMSTQRNGIMADMGLINQRYTLAMMASNELQIRSWTSRLSLRFAETIPFTWQPGIWYRMKFQGSNEGGKAVLRGKVWPRDSQEPETWQIEAADATPNTIGSPGMFGNASDAEFLIDNVEVFSNPEK